MSEIPPVIINLDDCPKKKSILIGSAVSFVLTINPMTVGLCCMPLIIGGLVSVFHYTKSFGVSISIVEGLKLGIFSCLLGLGASYVLYDFLWLVFDYQIGMETYLNFVESIVEKMGPEVAETYRKSMELSDPTKFTLMSLVSQIFSVAVSGAGGGSIGGLLGAAIFKKGPLAQ